MFYKMSFNRNCVDYDNLNHENTIYAEKSNTNSIEHLDIKKGWFSYIITLGKIINDWPVVKFYYNSNKSVWENEFLLNIDTWPIIHKKVQQEFEENGIHGIQYLPIKLIDVVTNQVNTNYVVMNILNFIEAIDLEKSTYTYNEKYDLYSFLPHTTYLDVNVCQNYDIFRATKSSISIYVSQKIKDIAEENKWIGFEFYLQQIN